MAVTEWSPTTATELSRIVAENYGGAQQAFIPAGGRTSLVHAANPDTETVYLLTGQLNRVVDYPSRDMTITVEAGIRVEALQEILRQQGQQLPIDVPQAGRASLGGAIAANVSGPSRYGLGTFRDYLIGVSAVDGQGRLFSAGGRVVKNVAGYDLCKLMIGSLGRLATITEVTLKLRPLSEANVIVFAAFDKDVDLEPLLAKLNKSETRPTVLDLLNPKAAWQLGSEMNIRLPDGKNVLWIEFAGTSAEVAWQAETIQHELEPFQPISVSMVSEDDYASAHEALVEFQTTSDDPVTFRVSFPKSRSQEVLDLATENEISLQVHAGSGVAYGHLPDRCTSSAVANHLLQPFRQLAEVSGGGLTVLNSEADWLADIELAGRRTGSLELMKNIKNALDPAGLMSPGKFL